MVVRGVVEDHCGSETTRFLVEGVYAPQSNIVRAGDHCLACCISEFCKAKREIGLERGGGGKPGLCVTRNRAGERARPLHLNVIAVSRRRAGPRSDDVRTGLVRPRCRGQDQGAVARCGGGYQGGNHRHTSTDGDDGCARREPTQESTRIHDSTHSRVRRN